MVRTLTALLLFCLSSFALAAQDLTGVWRGSFYNQYEYLFYGLKYRYEVQIKMNGAQAKGVTFSYQNTKFYGKASMVGKWSPSGKDLTLMENKMLEIKMDDNSIGCLMTCYLRYRKEGDREILEGTYNSVNMNNDTAQCGGGVVRLERVQYSDFGMEDFLKDNPKADPKGGIKPGQGDFLIMKPAPTASAGSSAKPPAGSSKAAPPKSGSGATAQKPATKPPAQGGSSATAKPAAPKTSTPKPAAPSTKPGTSNQTAKTPTGKPATPAEGAKTSQQAKPTPQPQPGTVAKAPSKPATVPADAANRQMEKTPGSTEKASVPAPATATAPAKPVIPPPPAVLKNRKNELVETISTAARKLDISFYDNGEIDGDTITVFANNRLVVAKKRLTADAITISIDLDEQVPEQEIIMVAENLGTIPPNTALMIVQAGAQRYAVRLSSNEQKNAVVRFRYDPNALK